jgi:hypothetical protein
MSKRSSLFERRDKDYYPTPEKAIFPLLNHLPKEKFYYCEPCAGDGRLLNYLDKYTSGKWVSCYDIEPKQPYICQKDTIALSEKDVHNSDYIITNPPWSRNILHPMIFNFRNIRPTWLLFDLDWAATHQAQSYLKFCEKIVVVGRLKWIENSPHTSKDNCAWYLFKEQPCQTIFINGD